MFITFEGGEGCGKSTQAKLLAEYLKEKGLEVIHTREPGGTKRGEILREVLLDKSDNMATFTELFLFSAARSEHVEKVILPALKAGKWVISDRYIDSTTAYQIAGRGLPEDVVRFVNMVSSEGVVPDLTLLLDLDVTEGLRRVKENRDEITKFEAEDLKFHQKVREKFLEVGRNDPQRIKIINAALDIDKIAKEIENVVKGFLNES